MSFSEHPYSAARVWAGLGFASGALSVDENYQPVSDPKHAFDAAFRILEDRFRTVDIALDQIIKITYFVTDIDLRVVANEDFATRFPDNPPARTFVEVARLPYGASVELDAVASA